jgi:hypothetical protein
MARSWIKIEREASVAKGMAIGRVDTTLEAMRARQLSYSEGYGDAAPVWRYAADNYSRWAGEFSAIFAVELAQWSNWSIWLYRAYITGLVAASGYPDTRYERGFAAGVRESSLPLYDYLRAGGVLGEVAAPSDQYAAGMAAGVVVGRQLGKADAQVEAAAAATSQAQDQLAQAQTQLTQAMAQVQALQAQVQALQEQVESQPLVDVLSYQLVAWRRGVQDSCTMLKNNLNAGMPVELIKTLDYTQWFAYLQPPQTF